jgi:hypothetical protein
LPGFQGGTANGEFGHARFWIREGRKVMQRYGWKDSQSVGGPRVFGPTSDGVYVEFAEAQQEKEAYGRAGYENGVTYGRNCEREEILVELQTWGRENNPGSYTQLLENIRRRGEVEPAGEIGRIDASYNPSMDFIIDRINILVDAVNELRRKP